MALLIFLVLLLGELLSQASDLWLAGEGRSRRNQNGRAIADVVRRELKGALLPINPSNQAGLQLVVNPTLSADYLNPSAIFWQMPMATDQQFGDVAEVGYFVAWDDLQPQLRRFYASLAVPGATSSPSSNTNFLIRSAPDNWINNDVLDAACPADASRNYEGLFAENVVGLWIRCLDPEGNPIAKDASGAAYGNTFDSRRGYQYTDSDGQTVVKAAGSLPPLVEISLAQLDTRHRRRIDTQLKQKILSRTAETATASEFVTAALKDTAFNPIREGLHSYTMTVFLQNSR